MGDSGASHRRPYPAHEVESNVLGSKLQPSGADLRKGERRGSGRAQSEPPLAQVSECLAQKRGLRPLTPRRSFNPPGQHGPWLQPISSIPRLPPGKCRRRDRRSEGIVGPNGRCWPGGGEVTDKLYHPISLMMTRSGSPGMMPSMPRTGHPTSTRSVTGPSEQE